MTDKQGVVEQVHVSIQVEIGLWTAGGRGGVLSSHELGKDVHAPGYYLHIDNTGCFLAAGMWRPEASALAKVRERIATRPAGWKRARDARSFKSTITLDGESLKRPPRGYSDILILILYFILRKPICSN